ncbi:hypothetical protein [Aliikangiella sp. IMCC44359]|uniref:hypothetical protein n=1 Tax=Aliikangiella sp. IMCC44359 TaxID=3459125 RepID=UPI00403A8944
MRVTVKSLFTTCLCIFFLNGCQSKDEPPTTTPSPQTTTDPKMESTCLQSTSPIHEPKKIESMLLKQGTITADMSQAQRNQIIDDFVKRKNQAFKACNTKGKK